MKWVVGAFCVGLVLFAPILGYISSPLAAFYLRGTHVVPPPILETLSSEEPAPDPFTLSPMPAGYVSDATRYQLARGAGWTSEDAILATAISLAEDGSGNPAALSGMNFNGTRDLGLWQINSNWWPQFGGAQALVDPWRNAQAAYYIKGRQGWCAWSTYGPCPTHACGPPCYSTFLNRARQASQVLPLPGQA